MDSIYFYFISVKYNNKYIEKHIQILSNRNVIEPYQLGVVLLVIYLSDRFQMTFSSSNPCTLYSYYMFLLYVILTSKYILKMFPLDYIIIKCTYNLFMAFTGLLK